MIIPIILTDAAAAALRHYLSELNTNSAQAETESPKIGHLMRLNQDEIAHIEALLQPARELSEVTR